MATKTVSIDLVAYDRLVSVRKGNESFSEIIKRVVPPPLNVEEYCKALGSRPLSDRAIQTIEMHIRRRRTATKRVR